MKNVDLSSLAELVKQNENGKDKSGLAILKTHRFFSDLHDDDHHEQHELWIIN